MSLVLVQSEDDQNVPAVEENQGIYLSAWKRLPEQPSGTTRFFDKSGDGDNFVVYGSDAQEAARRVFGTEAAVRVWKYQDIKKEDKGFHYLFMNRNNFESYVRQLLLIEQRRVEVYINESGSKTRIDWDLKFKASPGNLTQFEDILFAGSGNEITVNNGVVGIRVGNVEKTKTVGIAHINMNEREINLIQVVDNENLSNLESILVQLCPKEAVFPVSPGQTDDVVTLRKLLERNRILCNELKLSDFSDKDITEDCAKILQTNKGKAQHIESLPEFENKTAMSALAGAMKYLELLSGEVHQNQFVLKPFDFGLYVKLDASACRALHLTQNLLEKRSRNDISLLATIDRCRTAQGHRLMGQIVRQPLLTKEKLEERLDVVEILVNDIILRQSLRDDHFRRVPDCQTLSKKLIRKKATLQDCYRAYQFILRLENLIQDLKHHESDKQELLQSLFIDPIVGLFEDLTKFKDLIQTTLDMEMAEKGEYVVSEEFDDTFKDLREKMREVQGNMGKLLYKAAKDLDLEKDKSIRLESNNIHGYYFRCTLKEEKALRGKKTYEILQSTKGAVNFRTSELEDLSESYSRYRLKHENEQKLIVDEMSTVAADYHVSFEQLGRVIAELDVFASFADVSAKSPVPYTRPKLLPRGSGKTHIKGLRHPCIETFSEVSFIPNDVEFDADKQMFYIITGPNMGGKSTFLRSVGIAVLLAQVGCFVPAVEAEISLVDAILARVGASDSLSKGVSTFMAEMIDSSYILKTATKDSLVLIDELGRGTSTYDGFGLCWAISRHIAKEIGCYGLLATHFHEITSLADEIPRVVNYHVTAAIAGEEGLIMLYKIEKGACDRSFGIHVAASVGFPESVLEGAKEMSKQLEDFSQEEDQDDNEEAVLRRKTNKMEGRQIIAEFVGSLRLFCKDIANQIKNGSLSKEEGDAAYKEKLQTLLDKVKESKNPYVEHLLNQPCFSSQPSSQHSMFTPELSSTDDSEELVYE